MVVDRRRRHRRSDPVPADVALGGQVVPPGGDFAWGDGGDAVVAEPGEEPGGEPFQVPGDLPRDFVGPYPPDREVEVALCPGGEAVVGVHGPTADPDDLS